jgi:hypothetical protein
MTGLNNAKTVYEIRVAGVIDHTWSDWFAGFSITSQGEESLLQGEVVDQAALLGLLSKIINLGLTLVAVNRKMESGS